MFPTPDLSHLTKDDYKNVYEPAEDTFILLDALEQDADNLKGSKPRLVLEIGSGSGCVSSFAASVIGPSNALFICTDVNPLASKCTVSTSQQNETSLDAVTTSLALGLLPRLHHAIDVLLFNPPYVPTVPDEADDAQASAGIQGAWAGGGDGMQVTDALLKIVGDLLSDTGRFYLVAVKANNIPRIQAGMLQQHGLHSAVTFQRRAGREHLFVLRFHH